MNSTFKTTLQVIGAILAIGLAACLLWYLSTVFMYILIAAILSLMGRPLVRLFTKIKVGKKQLPSSIGALLTMAVMVLLFSGFLSLFAPLVAEEARIISTIDVQQLSSSLEEPLKDLEVWLNQYQLSSNPDVSNEEYIKSKLGGLISTVKISDVFKNLFGALGNIFIAIFSIGFITFFFLKDRKLIYNIIFTLTPKKHLTNVKHIIKNSKKLLTRYFLGVLAQVIIVTTLVSIGLSIIGVKNALIIGLFAGVINIIPYIGPLIGASIGIFFGLTSHLELNFYTEMLPLAGQIALVFLIVQLLDNFVLQPFIFANSAKMHPLEVFLVILIAGTLANIPGMILAIPVYTIVRVMAVEFLSKYELVQQWSKNMKVEEE